MNCPECNRDLDTPAFGRFRCPDCLTWLLSRASGLAVIETAKPTFKHSPLPVKKVVTRLSVENHLCVGCRKEVDNFSAVFGRLYTRTGFITREKVSLILVDGKLVRDVVEKKLPISQFVEGMVCTDCQTFENIEHTRQDGSVWYEPKFKPGQSSTEHDTLNPGDSSAFRDSESPDNTPAIGFGPEHPNYDFFGRKKEPETLHVPSYLKFGKAKRG